MTSPCLDSASNSASHGVRVFTDIARLLSDEALLRGYHLNIPDDVPFHPDPIDDHYGLFQSINLQINKSKNTSIVSGRNVLTSGPTIIKMHR